MNTLTIILIASLTIVGCSNTPHPFDSSNQKSGTTPFRPDTALVGAWNGEIDSSPMWIDIDGERGGYGGTFCWQAGDPVVLAQIGGVRLFSTDSIEISVVRPGTRTTILILTGRRSGTTMSGTFVRLPDDVSIPEGGSWFAWRSYTNPVIFGSWGWVQSVGGIGGWTLTPPPYARVVFGTDGTFVYYRADTLVASTTYRIVREVVPFFGSETLNIIHYGDPNRFMPQAFTVVNDSLILNDLCIDCYTHLYRKVQIP